MAYSQDDSTAVVYPMVQEVDGELVDFTRPPYDYWAGYNNAVEKRDTLHMSPVQAK